MTDRKKLTAKERDQLPAMVAKQVKAWQKQYSTRQVNISFVETDWRLYIDEGATYVVYHIGTDKSASFKAQSQDSLHAGGQPISHAVGQYCPSFPAGTFVLEEKLFLGKSFIDVYVVGGEQLQASTESAARVEVIF